MLAAFNLVGDSIGMRFRCTLAFLVCVLSFAAVSPASAVDCVEAKEGYDEWGRSSVDLTIVSDACGSLKVIDRRRDDTRLRVDIHATYPVFDPPRDAAERRYNEWVTKRPAGMNFAGPVDLSGSDVADTMVGLLYRSTRLLSARIGGWICCGAHGYTWAASLNIDSRTGRDVQLDDLVEVQAVADFCWSAFSTLSGPTEDQGKFFAQAYPRERFVDLLKNPVWSVSGKALMVELGYLLGYIGAEFDCVIGAAQLPRFVKQGIAVPF